MDEVFQAGLSEPEPGFLAEAGAEIYYPAPANTNTVAIFTVHNKCKYK